MSEQGSTGGTSGTSGTGASTSLGEFHIATKVIEVFKALIRSELKKLQPAYRYGTVTTIDRRNNRCYVTFAGSLGSVWVPLGGTVPSSVGQTVLVDGLHGDRRVADVIGPAADAWPATAKYNLGTTLPPGYLVSDGTFRAISTPYLDLAYYLGWQDTYAQQVLGATPSHYWDCQSVATPLADTAGDNLTVTGTPVLVTGPVVSEVNYGLAMGASVTAASATAGDGYVSQSASLWVNLATNSKKGIFFGKGVAAGSGGWAIGVGSGDSTVNGNHIIIAYWGVRYIDTGVNIGTGWHHIVLTVDASGHPTVWLDGANVYTDSSTGPNATVAGALYTIGGAVVGGQNVDASVSEVATFARVLNATDIKYLYYRGLNQFYTPDETGMTPQVIIKT